MRCFYHQDADAVGTCKHCARGLCLACARQRSGPLACPDRCETAVDAVERLVQGNIRGSQPTAAAAAFPVLFLAAGVAIVIYSRSVAPGTREIVLLVGAFIVVLAMLRAYALWRYWSQRRA